MTKYGSVCYAQSVGRPLELDDIKAKRIVDVVAKGGSRTAAAAAARISRSALMQWLARGRDGEQPFQDFLHRVKAAEAQAEDLMVSAVRTAAMEPRYWQAAAWWLERARPAEWAKREATQEQAAERAESDGMDLDVARSVVAALESRKVG